MIANDKDTIVAIATARGEGGIGILRLSGDKAFEIGRALFRLPSKDPNSFEVQSHRFYYGHIVDPASQKIVDETMTVFMKSPSSYTKEDVVEIQCHGGLISMQKILELCISQGARLAERGEFTKRAFLNGRLDLTQAEAVMDMIKAETDKKYDIALDQLEGRISKILRELRAQVLAILAQLTVNIDFPDEDIEEENYENLQESVEDIYSKLDKLCQDAQKGQVYREGIELALIGRPNVGKSSLLNALLGQERAIVTSVPGTTRDTIREMVEIDGIPVFVTDTAGIRDTGDEIEKMGVERSKEAFNEADIVLLMLDASQELNSEEEDILSRLDEARSIIFVNKDDLPERLEQAKLKEKSGNVVTIRGSVFKNEGIELLIQAISNKAVGSNPERDQRLLISNARQYENLRDAAKYLQDAKSAIDLREPFEIIDLDVKLCYTKLGNVLGEELGEDIIDEVFSRFCLGK